MCSFLASTRKKVALTAWSSEVQAIYDKAQKVYQCFELKVSLAFKPFRLCSSFICCRLNWIRLKLIMSDLFLFSGSVKTNQDAKEMSLTGAWNRFHDRPKKQLVETVKRASNVGRMWTKLHPPNAVSQFSSSLRSGNWINGLLIFISI